MMTRGLALLFVTLTSACGGFGSGTCEDDPGGRHHAVNPATGECWEFASSCDVPAEWASCGGEPECDETRACPADRICQEGICVPVGGACASDLDCPDTQHCEWASPSPDPSNIAVAGTCVDNLPCFDDSNCPIDQWCDTTVAPDCDPTLPDCGIAYPGLCSRGPRPGVCAVDADCEIGSFCLAPITGEPVCEKGCAGDVNECASDEYCTTVDGYCLSPPSNGGAPVPTVCYGWCETRAGLCDNAYEDCAVGEVCTAEWTGMPPGTCEPSCDTDAACAPGTHCNNLEGVCVNPHWKRDTGGGGKKGGASGTSGSGGASDSESDALIPICYGWCVP